MSTTNGKKAAPPAVLIPIAEINGLVGGNLFCRYDGMPVETWFDQRGYRAQVVEDWAGRASLPVEVAAEAVSAYRRECDENDAKTRAYEAYLKERRVEQRRLLEEAAEKHAAETAKMTAKQRAKRAAQAEKQQAVSASKAQRDLMGVTHTAWGPEPISVPRVKTVSQEEFAEGKR